MYITLRLKLYTIQNAFQRFYCKQPRRAKKISDYGLLKERLVQLASQIGKRVSCKHRKLTNIHKLLSVLHLVVCLHRTANDSVLKGEGHPHETEVEHKHGHSEQLGHLPAGQHDTQEHRHQHREQQHDGAAQALARHRDGLLEDDRVEEPGQRQPVHMVGLQQFISVVYRGGGLLHDVPLL